MVLIEAAGGVVWRRTRQGRLKVLLVHRPAYDDWSLPKGKLDLGEEPEEAALREVEEETGLRCRLGPELSQTRYVDRKGRDKLVRYWAMEPVTGAFRPSSEVDEVRWLRVERCASVLSYARDAVVVGDVRRLPSSSG